MTGVTQTSIFSRNSRKARKPVFGIFREFWVFREKQSNVMRNTS
jgi:hypothetical protein